MTCKKIICLFLSLVMGVVSCGALAGNAHASDTGGYVGNGVLKNDVRRPMIAMPSPILVNDNKQLSQDECKKIGFSDGLCKRYHGKYCFWVLDKDTGLPVTSKDLPAANHLAWDSGPQGIGIQAPGVLDEKGTVCFEKQTTESYNSSQANRMDLFYGSYGSWYFNFTGWIVEKYDGAIDYGFDCNTTSMFVLQVPNDCKAHTPNNYMYFNEQGILTAIFLKIPDSPIHSFAITGSKDLLIAGGAFAVFCFSVGFLIPTGSDDKKRRKDV